MRAVAVVLSLMAGVLVACTAAAPVAAPTAAPTTSAIQVAGATALNPGRRVTVKLGSGPPGLNNVGILMG